MTVRKILFTLLTTLFSTAFISACGDLGYDPNDSEETSNVSSALHKGYSKLEQVEHSKCIGFNNLTVGSIAKFVNCHNAQKFRYNDDFQLVMEGTSWPSKCLDSKMGSTSTDYIRLQNCRNSNNIDIEYQQWYFVRVPGKKDTYRIMSSVYHKYIDDATSTTPELEDDSPTCNGSYDGCQDFRNIRPDFFDHP